MSGPDRIAVQRSFGRAAPRFEASDFFHAEIRQRLLERLDLIRLEPAVVADLGSGLGRGSLALVKRFSCARVLALDFAVEMLRTAGSLQAVQRICADGAALPLADGSVDLVLSNLMLHWCAEPGRVLQEVQRVLRSPGLFSFSVLGPGTLAELRGAWARVDSHPHVLVCPEMHNLGDALVTAGFSEPVLDTENLTVTYPDVRTLAADLRAIGATNLTNDRNRGLTSPGAWNRMLAAYESFRDADGRLRASIEVIYGQAWIATAAHGQRRSDGAEINVPLRELTRRGGHDLASVNRPETR